MQHKIHVVASPMSKVKESTNKQIHSFRGKFDHNNKLYSLLLTATVLIKEWQSAQQASFFSCSSCQDTSYYLCIKSNLFTSDLSVTLNYSVVMYGLSLPYSIFWCQGHANHTCLPASIFTGALLQELANALKTAVGYSLICFFHSSICCTGVRAIAWMVTPPTHTRTVSISTYRN